MKTFVATLMSALFVSSGNACLILSPCANTNCETPWPIDAVACLFGIAYGATLPGGAWFVSLRTGNCACFSDGAFVESRTIVRIATFARSGRRR